jgi:hypothetical protein
MFCAVEYYHKGRRACRWLCCCCRSCRHVTDRVAYVGGLDSNGAPHGLGAWHDTYKHGELLVGYGFVTCCFRLTHIVWTELHPLNLPKMRSVASP